MADFFKKIGKSISDTSKNVKESVADSREKSALRRQIAAANNKIEQIKISIGDIIYGAYTKDDEPEDCVELCKQIDELLQNVEKYKEQILAIDGIKKCPNCGLEINVDSVFCSHCGAKQIKDEDAKNGNDNSDGDGYVGVGN